MSTNCESYVRERLEAVDNQQPQYRIRCRYLVNKKRRIGVFLAFRNTSEGGEIPTNEVRFGWAMSTGRGKTKGDRWDRYRGLYIAIRRGESESVIDLQKVPSKLRAQFVGFVDRSKAYFKDEQAPSGVVKPMKYPSFTFGSEPPEVVEQVLEFARLKFEMAQTEQAWRESKYSDDDEQFDKLREQLLTLRKAVEEKRKNPTFTWSDYHAEPEVEAAMKPVSEKKKVAKKK